MSCCRATGRLITGRGLKCALMSSDWQNIHFLYQAKVGTWARAWKCGTMLRTQQWEKRKVSWDMRSYHNKDLSNSWCVSASPCWPLSYYAPLPPQCLWCDHQKKKAVVSEFFLGGAKTSAAKRGSYHVSFTSIQETLFPLAKDVSQFNSNSCFFSPNCSEEFVSK